MPEIDVAERVGDVLAEIQVILRRQDRLTAIFPGLCRRLCLFQN